MNIFIGVGQIIDVETNGKVLKFNLSIQQEKPCNIPCIVFDPAEQVIGFVADIQLKEQVIWMQGKISCNEYDYQGKTRKNFVLVPFVKSIKIIE